MRSGKNFDAEIEEILSASPSRKDWDQRYQDANFYHQDKNRNDLAAHVYDITYGTVRPKVDNLIVIDDSIYYEELLCVEHY